jgi:DNA-binding beta-propeller fold protein YncE
MKVKHLLGIIAIVLVTIGVVTFFSQSGGNNADSVSRPKFLFSIMGEGSKTGLKEPSFAISDNRGKIFVSDTGNKRICVFNNQGNFLYDFGGTGSKKPLVYPYGIGIIDSKRVIVADTGAGALYEYNTKGEFVKLWLDTSAGIQPAAIHIVPDKEVYITDLAGRQVVVFSPEGKLLRKITSKGASLGALLGMAVESNGDIWLADGSNYNVKLLSQQGTVKKVFDGGPKLPLSMAKGLALDQQGRVYVADTLSDVIRVFDKNGNDLITIGTVNEGKRSFQLPVGVSVDNNGKVYIADQGNNKVQVWGWR